MKGKSTSNVGKIIITMAIIVTVYSFSSVLTDVIWNRSTRDLDRSLEGNTLTDVDPNDLVSSPLTFDMSALLASLLDLDFFNSLNDTEKMEFLENMFGDGIEDYLNDMNQTADDFMEDYNTELADLLESMGGQSFDSGMLDDFPPELYAILIAREMFYVYEEQNANPAYQTWDNKEDTLFKMASYDQYNLSSFEWQISSQLTSLTDLAPTTADSSNRKWKIKSPQLTMPDIIPSLPTISPTPYISSEFSSNPVTPTNDPGALKYESNLGGAYTQLSYDANDINTPVNFTYQLLYDSDNYHDDSYYNGLGYSMEDYIGSDTRVTNCLLGPISASGTQMTWQEYAAANPYFAAVAADLLTVQEFQDATTTYEKMEVIQDYIGTVFTYSTSPVGAYRPDDGEDPLEWFCEGKISSMPFEFTYLSTALARMNGISTRYVSGYKHNQMMVDAEIPFVFPDSTEPESTGYSYRVGNLYTWVEAYIPISTTSGHWVEFENTYVGTVTLFDPAQATFDVAVDGNFDTVVHESDRYEADDFTTIDIDVGVSYKISGSGVNAQMVNITDITYGRELGSFSTNSAGAGSLTIHLKDLEPGVHVLNVSTLYGGSNYIYNATVINVLDDMILTSSLNMSSAISPWNVPVFITIDGHLKDEKTDNPIKGAVIDFTALGYPTLSWDQFDSFTLTSGGTITNALGDFTAMIDIPGYPIADNGRVFNISSVYNGTYDVTADVLQFSNVSIRNAIFNQIDQFGPSDYEYLTSPANQIEYHRNITEQFEIEAGAGYVGFFFSIDGITSYNGALPDYGVSGPPTGNRLGPFNLQLGATTILGSSPAANVHVIVCDDSEAGREVTSFWTNSTGEYDGTFDLALDASLDLDLTNWTVGPHLLRFQWDGTARNSSIWIVVQDQITVDQTSDAFTVGSYNYPTYNNYYYINTRNQGDQDSFQISGTVTDTSTGEFLSDGALIHFGILNSTFAPLSTTYLEGDTDQVLDPAGFTSTDLNFSSAATAILGQVPIYPIMNFTGEWYNLGFGWDNSWNSAWSSYFSGFGTFEDRSLGNMYLADPSLYDYVCQLDGVNFPAGPSSARVKTNGDVVSITLLFSYGGTPIEGVSVTLIDTIDTITFNPVLTDSNGLANFTFTINNSMVAGIHTYEFDVSADLGFTYTSTSTTLDIDYDPSLFYNTQYYLDAVLFSSLSDPLLREKTVDDEAEFSMYLQYNLNGTGVSGATVVLWDLSDSISWEGVQTDVTGYGEYTFTFNTTMNPGSHTYRLYIQFNDGVNFITLYGEAVIEYNPNAAYSIAPKLNQVDFLDLTPSGDRIIGLDESVNLSVILYQNLIPVDNLGYATITVYYPGGGSAILMNNEIINNGGTAFEMLNFGSFDDNGIYTYTIEVSIGFPIDYNPSIRTVEIEYDKTITYNFTTSLDGLEFSGNPITVDKNVGDTVNFTAQIKYNVGSPLLHDVDIELRADGVLLNSSTILTGDEYAIYISFYNDILTPRLVQYNLSISCFIHGTSIPFNRYELINIDYRNPGDVFFTLSPEINGTGFSSANNTMNLSYGENFEFDAQLEDNVGPIAIGDVNIQVWDVTGIPFLIGSEDTLGGTGILPTIVFTFNENITAGIHIFMMTYSYTYSSYPFTYRTYTQQFLVNPIDPAFYTLVPYYNDTSVHIYQDYEISGYLTYLGNPVNNSVFGVYRGGTLVESDISVSQDTSDTDGYGNFTLTYSDNSKPGSILYTLNATYKFGIYKITKLEYFTITLENPVNDFRYNPEIDGISIPTTTRSYNNTESFSLDINVTYPSYWSDSGLTDVSFVVSDSVAGTGFSGSINTSAGLANILLTYDPDLITSGTHTLTLTITISLTGQLITKIFYTTVNLIDVTDGFTFGVYLDEVLMDNTIIKKSNGSVLNASIVITNATGGVQGANVHFYSYSNSQLNSWTITDGAGVGQFVIDFNSSAFQLGAQEFHISFNYTWGYSEIIQNYTFWIIYDNSLDMDLQRDDAFLLTQNDVGSYISLFGYMQDGEDNSHGEGYLYSTINFTVYNSNMDDVSNLFTVDNVIYDTTLGNYSFRLHPKPNAGLGAYTVKVTHQIDVSAIPPTLSAKLYTNLNIDYTNGDESPTVAFEIYDYPEFVSTWDDDTHHSNVGEEYFTPVPSQPYGSKIDINGTLTYSNSSAIEIELLWIYVDIYIDDGVGGYVLNVTLSVQIDANGYFEIIDHAVEQDYIYYVLRFDATPSEQLYSAESDPIYFEFDV